MLDIDGTVLVTGASKRQPSLGLDAPVTPLSISAAERDSPGSIWRRVEFCEQRWPRCQLRAETPTGTEKPSGSCHNGAQRQRGAEYSIERVQKGLEADWSGGKGLRRLNDGNANHYNRGGP